MCCPLCIAGLQHPAACPARMMGVAVPLLLPRPPLRPFKGRETNLRVQPWQRLEGRENPIVRSFSSGPFRWGGAAQRPAERGLALATGRKVRRLVRGGGGWGELKLWDVSAKWNASGEHRGSARGRFLVPSRDTPRKKRDGLCHLRLHLRGVLWDSGFSVARARVPCIQKLADFQR